MAWLWLGVAIAFIVAEVVTVAFFALFGAVGALAAAIAASLGFGFEIQAIVFTAASLLGMLTVRPLLMRYFAARRGSKLLSGAEEMLGQSAMVVDPIKGPHQPGHVRIGGEDWPAISADGKAVHAGREVLVVELRNATLVVSAK